MSVWLKRLMLAALFFGLLPGASLEAQDASNQENGAGAIASGGGGFRALSGAEAAFFILPDDVDLVSSRRIERYGLTYERYQQVFGGAKVLGGQLTLYRDDDGDISTVIGAHYPGIVPTNAARLAAAEARGIADRDIGPAGQRITDLMIDPRSGRYFFWVETRRADSRWILWIGAQNGQIFNKYNALMHQTCGTGLDELPAPCGLGVEQDAGLSSDIKNLTGQTSWSNTYNAYMLWSQDDRRGTYDYGASTVFTIPIAKDLDDVWDTLGDESPAQQAMVDSHYYAYITDTYFKNTHDFDWVLEGIGAGMRYDFMAVFAHHNGAGVNNAFWNGNNISLGDGDQVNFREFTSLDVITHELTHGVTDFTSNLIYQNESGALNEAFSDIMAASVEYYADTNGMEPAAGVDDPLSVAPLFAPDFLIGEDIDLRVTEAVPGIRNMADPEEDATTLPGPVIVTHPDHYLDRYTGSDDNGGVHINSGIPNHAYYLLVNGGRNASCVDDAAKASHNSDHCNVSDPTVAEIGIADAEQIFFMAFTALNSTATMCDARLASEAAALSLPSIAAVGLSNGDLAQSTNDAWIAVGITDLECGLIGDPEAPARPTLLSATHDGAGNVALVWADNADNEEGYRVFRNGAEIGTTLANIKIYTDNGVPDGTYGYHVQAHNTAFTTDSNLLTVQIGNQAYASSESTTFGTVSGSYANTVAPGDAEVLTETTTTGRNKTSLLEHIWRIDNVNLGGFPLVRLVIAAAADSNSDSDDFEFSYSTGGIGGNYTTAFVLARGTGQTAIVALPDGTDGTIHVKVRDSNRAKGKTSRDSVSVSQLYIEWGDGFGNLAPTASFTYSCTDLSCTFDGSGSSDSDGSIMSYEWNFGDGSSASGATADHSYADAGANFVILTVTDNSGASDTDTKSVSVSVTVPGSGDFMHVHELTGSGSLHRNGRKWTASVAILMLASDEATPVSGALVAGTWGNGASGASSCTTDGAGRCSIGKGGLRLDTASVTFTVDNVTGTLAYDKAANEETTETILGP